MNGLTYTEVILGILIPLILGAYGYAWLGFKSVWDGLTETRKELKADIDLIVHNPLNAVATRSDVSEAASAAVERRVSALEERDRR